jgi:putative membrane protein
VGAEPGGDAGCAEPETLRLHQANERTVLAWLRSGIALMAFGFALARFGLFLQAMSATAAAHAAHAAHALESVRMGGALVVLGTVANLAATVRYHRVRRAIERGQVGAPSGVLVYAAGIAVALVGLVMTVLLARAAAQ